MSVFGCGLDLGQAADYTAFAVVQQTAADDSPIPDRYRHRYHLRHLERYDLGLPYTAVVERVKERLTGTVLQGSRVAADYTGVGRPVVDMLRDAAVPAVLTPVLITAGHQVTFGENDRAWHVPKKDIVGTLLVMLQAKLLAWHPSLPLADKLAKELSDFRTKISAAANEQFGAWRTGQHDDLVLAVALAVWVMEKYPGDGAGYYSPPRARNPNVDRLTGLPAHIFK